ncbi:MerR family transcriptional regulator [Streptomyces sp. Z26]|uniref:MerR family transcriptional regulator n=1 Tax=Streptomyces sp. Z26 TaxID=2500177 RepID=UPI000EF16819|nr:MerR family transcriptional regulator [Streptomyces sp. Z26]RLL69260.1 MerR family transcriptional regulator [Streptomyces sp. Z26]
MRIGQLAAVVGVTTRTVRHYHRIGLLPEPARQSNGYREYALRDAVELARVRRLTELGLSLDEVRDVLADDAGRDLAEILAELDADLARQEEAVRRRRARLRVLLEQDGKGGGSPAEAPVSAELAALFDDMARASAHLPGPEPELAARERELLALLETGSPDGDRGWLYAMGRRLGGDPAAVRRTYDVYARLDALAGADPDDPRVEEVARAVVACVPPDAARELAREAARDADRKAAREAAARSGGPRAEGAASVEETFLDVVLAELAPAQAAAVRRAIALLTEGAA